MLPSPAVLASVYPHLFLIVSLIKDIRKKIRTQIYTGLADQPVGGRISIPINWNGSLKWKYEEG